jgi:hypothetical protein
MENTAEMGLNEDTPQKKRGFGGWFVIIIRFLFILLFTAILLAGLYFKAPWKILVLDAVLLALLTVVPKKKRKYGWLTLAAAVLIMAVWIFIPEKGAGDWKPYTFDKELAALEAERIVPAEDNAAPLYEALFERWKQIKTDDPYPHEVDREDVTAVQPWTAAEFPEIAAWLERHDDFFQDLITATQKPGCYFPARATNLGSSESIERFRIIRRLAFHLIRASYLDTGEKRSGAWEKQMAVLDLGKHVHQQPLLIELLVSVSLEALAHQAMTVTLVNTGTSPEAITPGDLLAMAAAVRTRHFDHSKKWRQILAYEKLFGKNFWGMFYEINSQGEVRFMRPKNFSSVMQTTIPDMGIRNLPYSYWVGVGWKTSRVFLCAAGLPKDPAVMSEWVDEVYAPFEKVLEQGQLDFEDVNKEKAGPFELNYKCAVRLTLQLTFPAFKKIHDEIFPRVDRQKRGTEIVCDLVLYKNQNGRYPNTLDELESSGAGKQVASDRYSGFLYQKIKDDFLLYHRGQNGIDENGQRDSRRCGPGPEDSQGDKDQTADDILIWPRNEKERKQILGIEEPDEQEEQMMPRMG